MRWNTEGHKLAREQIRIHGKDRYPTPGAQYAKVLDELGEMAEAMIIHGRGGHGHGKCQRTGHDHLLSGCPEIRAEYADVGLALYELGNKLGIDLIEAMAEVVTSDTRRFGDG